MVILPLKRSSNISSSSKLWRGEKRFFRFFSFEIWTGYRQEKVRAAVAETAGEEKMPGLLFLLF